MPPPGVADRLMLRGGRVVVILLHILLCVLAGRCAYLQLHNHDESLREQSRYLGRSWQRHAPRGCIWTARGEALVRNEPLWVIALDPRNAAGPDRLPAERREAMLREAVAFAGRWFTFEGSVPEFQERVVRDFCRGRRYLRLATTASAQRLASFRAAERRERGVDEPPFGRGAFHVERRWRRTHPHGDVALQLVGEARTTGARDAEGRTLGGIFGLESRYDEILDGGLLTCVAATAGDLTSYRKVVEERDPACPGADLILTLDLKLQLLVEDLVTEARADTGARRVMAVVLDPRDGALLAGANAPLLERGDYRRLLRKQPVELERRLLDLDHYAYEPGSTIKPAIIAEAIDRGFDLTQPVTQGRREWRLHGHGIQRTIRDSGGPRGRPLSIEEALIHSSNIGMVQVGLMLGEGGLRRALARFGFTHRGRWDRYTTTSVPIGYEFYATPAQLLRMFAAIANGGFRVDPYLILAAGGEATEAGRRDPLDEQRRILAPATATTLRRLLIRAAREGTGRDLDCDPVFLAGKTGTSKVWENGGWAEEEYRSTFIGFAPWHRPRYLVYVLVDRPRGQYFGAQVAGPVARKIIGALMGEAGNPLGERLRNALNACDSVPRAPIIPPADHEPQGTVLEGTALQGNRPGAGGEQPRAYLQGDTR